jgi:hypothetical protein
MAVQNRRRLATLVIYLILLAGIAWQAKVVAELFGPGGKYPQVRTYKVNVTGDVRRPGTYRVPEGTTQFEILKVAGVRPTSYLSTFNLMGSVDQNSDLTVGSQDKQVELKQPPIFARLEFFFGDVALSAKDGRSLPVQEGVVFNEGDNIQTESSTQAEISIGAFSRMDLDNYSNVTFDKIGTQGDNQSVAELFQKSGACWYEFASASKNETYRILTKGATISVAGKGAYFLFDIQPDQTTVNLMDGQLLIERTGGGEAINLISGQSVKIYNDGRPFQISRLAPDISASERFTQLAQGKKTSVAKSATFDFLFCGTPAVFFIAHVQFDKGTISIIHLPPRLYVEPYAQGVSTLDEAYLYGGPTFVNSILERVFNTRLSRYCVFTKDNIIRTADILGGVSTELDQKAAAQLKVAQGNRKLTSQELVRFLSPSGVTPEEQQKRQRQVLGAIFDGMRSKNIVLTTQTIQQVLSSIETNMNATESMDAYMRFTTSASWTRKDLDLPVQESREKGRITYEPVMEKCRTLLEQ